MDRAKYIGFDWAIKRLLRNKADFVVVDGFLTALLNEPVKIEQVLESESNQETPEDKFNRVDLLVKDSRDRKVIIEVQNDSEADFFHRMLYGASKAITQYIALGKPYGTIGKIYSVNIVYFPLGAGRDYVYHGRNDFRGIHYHDILELNTSQRKAFGLSEAGDIFPEYFVIRVKQFNEAIRTPLDEWVYFLKTSEIPPEFTAPGLTEARERLSEYALTPEERVSYQRYLHYQRIKDAEITTALLEGEEKGEERGLAKGLAKGLAEGEAKGRAEGEARGRAEGEARGRAEGEKVKAIFIAQNLLKMGTPLEKIAAAVGLTQEEIEKLRTEG